MQTGEIKTSRTSKETSAKATEARRNVSARPHVCQAESKRSARRWGNKDDSSYSITEIKPDEV